MAPRKASSFCPAVHRRRPREQLQRSCGSRLCRLCWCQFHGPALLLWTRRTCQSNFHERSVLSLFLFTNTEIGDNEIENDENDNEDEPLGEHYQKLAQEFFDGNVNTVGSGDAPEL